MVVFPGPPSEIMPDTVGVARVVERTILEAVQRGGKVIVRWGGLAPGFLLPRNGEVVRVRFTRPAAEGESERAHTVS
jgi:hypothetical protein